MSARPPQPPPRGAVLANLASAPFVNRRPVQRFAVAAWVLGAMLATVNVVLWVQYRQDSTELRERLAATRAAIETESEKVVEIGRELRGFKLAAQNAQVTFLNYRIAERTFPWSLLFERVAQALPEGVRLLNLSPVFAIPPGSVGGDEKRSEASEDLVQFKLRGQARDAESLYQLVDAFFALPVFERPRLYSETREDGGVGFTIDVFYRPRFVPEPSERPAAAAGDGSSSPLDDGSAAGPTEEEQTGPDPGGPAGEGEDRVPVAGSVAQAGARAGSGPSLEAVR